MKQKLFFALAAAALAVACSKNAPVEGQDVTTLPDEEGLAPEAIRFSSNLSVFSAQTAKAGGALESWNNETLYIFGIDRAAAAFTAVDAILINNVEATAPDADPVKDPEGNVTAPASDFITLNDPAVTGTLEPFYYSGNTRYDFYGYYVDGAAQPADVVVEDAQIYIPVKITGGEDIMIAKADQATDIAGTEVTNPDYAYSAYSARRNVVPNLVFEHQLARFIFNVVGGNGMTNEELAKVNIESLSLTSLTQGTLYIAGTRGLKVEGVDLDQEPEALELKERVGNVLQPLTVAHATTTEEQLGESIMVIPGADSYKMVLKLSQTGATTGIKDQEYVITPNSIDTDPNVDGVQSATAIEAGKQYVITIKIYSLERVEINATLTPWENGGSSIFDPDAPETWE